MSQAEHVPLVPPADSEHDCPSCGHSCRQLERDFALFMQTGSFRVDSARGTPLDSGLPDREVRAAEQQGFVVGVKGAQPEPYALAQQLRQLAELVDREGQLRDTEHARRLGLAVARALGPRWTQRGRMIEEGTQR
jgi:hypothetical protein